MLRTEEFLRARWGVIRRDQGRPKSRWPLGRSPVTISTEFQNRVMERFQRVVTDADHRQIPLPQQGVEMILRRHIEGAGGFIQNHEAGALSSSRPKAVAAHPTTNPGQSV